MEVLSLETIAQLFGSLGTGALFIYLYFRERKESKETIDKKDAHIESLNQHVLVIVEQNTRASSELQSAIVANTQATNTLTERVTDVLLNRKK